MITKLLSLTAPDLRVLMREADEQGFSRAVKQKLQWFLFAVEHKHNISLTCRHFAITRSTFQRWLERFDAKNLSTLEEVSRRPNKVRLPETSQDIVALIRIYREQNATMGKELIRKLLQEEHSIKISASTIGRVIARNHFYFSEQSSHQMKIRAWAFKEEEKADSVAQTLSEELLKSTSIKEERISEEEVDDETSSTWFGPGLSTLLVVAGVGASLLFGGTAHAEESASFRILTNAPNEAAGSLGKSNSYAVEQDVTWLVSEAKTGVFQVVSEFQPSSSSAQSSAVSSYSSSFTSSVQNPPHQGGGGGGNGNPPAPSGPNGSNQGGAGQQIFAPRRLPIGQPGLQNQPGSPQNQPRAPGMRPSAPKGPAATPGGKALISNAQKRFETRVKANLKPAKSVKTNRVKSFFNGRFNGSIKAQTKKFRSTAASLLDLDYLSSFDSAHATLFYTLALLAIVVAYELGRLKEHRRLKNKKKQSSRIVKYQRSIRRTRLLAVALSILAFLLAAQSAIAAASVPNSFIYKGHLLSSSGTPITTPHNIRFSFWKSTDTVAGDIAGDGTINTGAANYVSWTEVQTVTPDSKGFFNVQLGAVSSLPDFASLPAASLANLHLQVEVKAVAQPITAYELLDINSSNSSIDRSPLMSLPFANNAALLDQRSLGSGAGNIPFLDGAALLAKALIPGGTNANFFTIDDDASVASGSIDLIFGTGLNKKLSYDINNSRFNFNSNLRVQGNLTVTGSLIVNGLINGVNINSLAEATATHLKVSSGAGLSADIAPGNYRVNGDITNYSGQAGISLTNNADNYLFFTSTGLTLSTAGFPTDKSFIPVAKVTTAGGAVSSVVDRRVLQSDDREQTMLWVLHPDFSDAAYQADGTNNVGQLSVASDNATGKNYYSWTTTRTSLQDYDISVRVTLPKDFAHWTDNPIKLNYKTATGNNAQNKIDVILTDTAGAPVGINGGTGLASASWAASNITFQGTPTWTPGETIIVKLRLSALNAGQVQLGDLEFNYIELH